MTHQFVNSDGGRAAAGFVGGAGDCVTRAIAIATGLGYRQVSDLIDGIGADPAGQPQSVSRWR
jgi:hypothetical protein